MEGAEEEEEGERETKDGRRRNGGTSELRERGIDRGMLRPSMDKWIGEEEKSMMRENRISRLPPDRPTEL